MAIKHLTLRVRLVATTTVAALVAVGVLVVGVQVLLAHVTRTESINALRDRADAAVTTVRGTPEHPRVLDVPADSLDQNLWIYDARGTRIDGDTPSPGLARAVASSSRVTRESSRVVSGRYRLLALPVRIRGRGPVVAVVVAGVDLTPYESFERRGLWLSLALGALIVVAAGTASWAAATYSLRRVRQMARRADEWREHDLSGRFALGPPREELTELAQTLDRMLDRISRAITTERRLTDEVAHELRTPLTAIRSEAELALLDSDVPDPTRRALVAVVDATEQMNRSISTILAVARSAHADKPHLHHGRRRPGGGEPPRRAETGCDGHLEAGLSTGGHCRTAGCRRGGTDPPGRQRRTPRTDGRHGRSPYGVFTSPPPRRG
ncbi:HAMP domain-containing sensor histidine kinase [Actinopolymorpha sp. NPDC004070]|uniref:HAMP domain-containing sensor histidine kinase n=1 Tax=Actinopolymorpha sp. NPDC004070 TaxID=3154548 RepID=UPI0033B6D606